MSNALAGTVGQAADDALVVRARQDRGAFAILYERYYPRVLRYCVRRLYVRAVAEDVVADVFVQIAGHLPGFRGTTEADFRRWLFGIASNAVSAHLRQTRRRQELWDAAARSRRLASVPDSGADGGAAVDLLDWPAVYQAILELEPRDQTILTLRYFADLSFEEIAGIVGAQAGAVRTALSRCLARLRDRFADAPRSDAAAANPATKDAARETTAPENAAPENAAPENAAPERRP